MKQLLSGLLVLFFVNILVFVFTTDIQAAGNLYFSPSSGTKYNGQNFTVAVRASGMDGVDAVKATFTYPAETLTLVGINSGGSGWDIKAEEGGGNGTVNIERGSTSSLTGDKLVANVTFRPKTNTGTVSLNFTGDSVLTRAGSNVLGGKSSATFTLAQPAAPPPPPPADTTAPIISEIKVVDQTIDSVTIAWKTNEAADSNVDYGTEKGYFINANKPELIYEHSLVLKSTFIEPGTTYHFIVRSKDAAGNEAKSENKTFTTLGYELIITLKDESGNSLTNTKVILYSDPQEAVSDSLGVVTFKNVKPGKHVLVVEREGQRIAQDITVKNTGAKEIVKKDEKGGQIKGFGVEPQKLEVKVASEKVDKSWLRILGLVTATIGTVIIAVILFIYLRKRKSPH